MEMTGEVMIRALPAVRTAVHHNMISEEEYIKKYADFDGKKDDTLANDRYYNTNTNEEMNKLGLSWAKLSCQLGFGCTVINICCLIFIHKK